MSFRGVNLNGQVRLFGDDALRRMISNAGNRHIRDTKLRKTVVERLLNHQYLSFDKARDAEERVQRERVKACLVRVEQLKGELAAERIAQLGLEWKTGSPHLTPERLSRGYSPKCIDIDQMRLLLSLERHPLAGRQPILQQYWLYDETAKILRLLEEGDWIQDPILTGPMMVSRDGHPWEPVETATEHDFLRQVESALGCAFRKKLVKTFEPAESGLISCSALPDAVVAQTKTLTGIDLVQQEKEAADKRQTEYAKKYGPPESSAPPSIYVGPCFRVGISPILSNRDEDSGVR